MVEIVEADFSYSCYDERRDTIIIDEKLKEYPGALEMVVLHELEHASIENSSHNILRKFLEHLAHELRHDWNFAFSSENSYIQYRRYHRKRESENPHTELIPFVRIIWALPLYAIMNFKAELEADS